MPDTVGMVPDGVHHRPLLRRRDLPCSLRRRPLCCGQGCGDVRLVRGHPGRQPLSQLSGTKPVPAPARSEFLDLPQPELAKHSLQLCIAVNNHCHYPPIAHYPASAWYMSGLPVEQIRRRQDSAVSAGSVIEAMGDGSVVELVETTVRDDPYGPSARRSAVYEATSARRSLFSNPRDLVPRDTAGSGSVPRCGAHQ